MKKITFALMAIVALLTVFTPSTNLYASTTTNISIIHPADTNYADLSDVIDFAVSEDNIYFTTTTNVSEYNTTNKTLSSITTGTNISAIYYLNNNLIVVDNNTITCTDNTSNTLTFGDVSDFESIDIAYYEQEYIIAYTKSGRLYVNTYSHPQTLITSINTTLEATDYYLTISQDEVYLISKNSQDTYKYLYKTNSLTELNHTNLNYSSKSNLFSTDTHLLVPMTDIIKVLNKTTFDETTFTLTEASSNQSYVSGQIDTPASMKYYNNKVYILDQTNKCIQSLNLSGNTLTANEVVLGSFGADLGRFNNVNGLALKDDSKIFISDLGNNRIQVITDEVQQVTNVKANDLTLDEYNNMFFYTNSGASSTIYRYSLNNGITPNGEFNYASLVDSLCIDNQNNIYLLDSTNNKIVRSNQTSNTITFEDHINLTDLGITSNSNSVIYSVNSTHDLVISVDNTIYQLNDNTPHTMTDTIVDFVIDFNQNIYALLDNGNIEKFNFTDNTSSSISGLDNCSTIELNQLNGKLYLFDNVLNCIKVVENNQFSSGMTNFVHYDLSISDNISKDYIFNYAKLNGLIFEYPNYLGKVYNTDSSIEYVVLLTNVRSLTPFEYVMFTIDGEVLCGYAKVTDLEINSTDFRQSSATKVALEKTVNHYKFPTLHCNNVITTSNQNELIEIYCNYPISIDGKNYYVTHTIAGYSYVYAGDVTNYNANYDLVIDSDNATIKVTDHSEYVAVYDDNAGTNQIDKLTPNKRVHVENYDKQNKYTYVTYLDEYGKEQGGWVLTKYVKTDTNNTLLVSSIIIFTGGIILAVILIVSYHRHKKNLK